VQPGDIVQAGDLLVILEAMKMEHEVRASHAGRVTELFFANGELVAEADLLLNMELLAEVARGLEANLTHISEPAIKPAMMRSDLQQVLDRQATTLDCSHVRKIRG
jgi:pyruvate/2-oxoglutarate dehydrogenase complex dihydrolipoamide acyltransferase (E2) component